MNILVTGANGFLGRNICQSLCNSGDNKIYAVLRREESGDVLTHSVNKIIINESSDFEAIMRRHDVEGVVHLASYFSAEHQPSEVAHLVESNILFASRVIDGAARAGVQWFINTSTFWQHFNNLDFIPVNLYAATKQAFESIIEYYRSAYALKILSMELTDVYGPGDFRNKLINKLIEAGGTREKILLSPGEQLIDLLHVNDVVTAYLVAIDHIKCPGAVALAKYSAASNQPVTLRELVNRLTASTGIMPNVVWGGRPYRRREYMAPVSMYARVPGWQPKIGLDDGLRSLVNMGDQPA